MFSHKLFFLVCYFNAFCVSYENNKIQVAVFCTFITQKLASFHLKSIFFITLLNILGLKAVYSCFKKGFPIKSYDLLNFTISSNLFFLFEWQDATRKDLLYEGGQYNFILIILRI